MCWLEEDVTIVVVQQDASPAWINLRWVVSQASIGNGLEPRKKVMRRGRTG